jgi:transposase
MVKKIPVRKYIHVNELKRLIRKEGDKRVLERLLFIYQLYLKDDVYEACKRTCVAIQTGYNWLKAWNKDGYDGLIPNFGGGRPAKLTNKQKEELRKILKAKENWLTSEVMGLIKKKFGVSYSLRHVSRILRSFGMHYSKPYPKDYRRPIDAKEILKERLTSAVKNTKGQCIIGFFDEASPQTTDNKQRYWSFNKSKIIKNTTKYKANTFGFYPINGKSVVDFKKNSKKESVCEFLRKIRENNPIKTIIAILDNFPSHKAEVVKEYAKSLNIILVFLPPYSPDLNPIEQIWRCIRRKISQMFVKSEHSFLETIRTVFCRLAKKSSFMKSWLEEFQLILSK